MTYARQHLEETARIAGAIDADAIERVARLLADLRARGGRLFFLGVGGSAANCSHAVNDFRKLAGVEAYTPVDNVAELTARVNDEGWETVFAAWLKASRLTRDDMVCVLSVGGGSLEPSISPNLVRALQYARQIGTTIVGILGRDGGYTAQAADACVIIPTVNPATITPHAEAFQSVVWHLLVSHPALKAAEAKWESTKRYAAPSSSIEWRSGRVDAFRERAASKAVHELSIKIFADGADLAGMLDLYRNPCIKGFTTNPTLMRKAGIADYRVFGRSVVAAIADRPVSFEVLSDDFDEMGAQAQDIASWGENVYVKIPVTNTRGDSARALITRLSREGVKLNVTALLPIAQVREVADALAGGAPACISVFAGRIADTGVDPVPLMAEAVDILRPLPNVELIWASPRELLNIFQADAIGCHIITVTHELLQKLALVGRDLHEYSLDTVKMFHSDAAQAGHS
ncbi:MAG TPA: transaldolase, partial [Vicinamibacterales bacterium]